MSHPHFIGREAELQSLRDLLKKKMASLVVIKGRRRIGKTRLIEEFARDERFLRFSGLAPTKNITDQDQRDEFSRLLSQQTSLPAVKSDDWAVLFSLLADQTQSGRTIILLDEITWMAHDDPTFLSKLKNVWELSFRKNSRLILVLCGSISAWIEKNILSSTGYFGRISKKITLHELSIIHCNTLMQFIGFNRSSYEKFLLLSLTGGIPWYIELINPSESAASNIKSLCFEKDGILVDEYRYIFHDLFGKRSEIYEKITRLLASGMKVYDQIVSGIQYTSSGKLSDYLDELIESGYISRQFSWDLKTGREKKISLYRLSDNYLRFYYKYIQPKLNLIKKGQYQQQAINALPAWNSITGFQFESLVLNNRLLIQQKLRLLPEDIIADNCYYQRETKRAPGCQIDYLIQTRTNTLFACEIKFSQHELSSSVIKEMREKIKKLSVPRNYTCLPVLIQVNGVSEEVQAAGYFYDIIDFAVFLETKNRLDLTLLHS